LCLYPAFAPLSVQMANHLLLLEERTYRRCPSRRPASPEMIQTVLQRIYRARKLAYDYMRPFVVADLKRQQHGENRTFPNAEWLLEALAQYAPLSVRNANETLDFWQKKGLLRRVHPRGLLDTTSVAALLTARLAVENMQRNWLPSFMETTDPYWWCFGRVSPESQIQAIPVPFSPSLPASMMVWTPWQGAIWEEQWQLIIGGEYLYRWAGSPSLGDLLLWEEDLPRKILDAQHDALFGRSAVQQILLQEARHDVLTHIVQKGMRHGSVQ
jgi:hypothetical protein